MCFIFFHSALYTVTFYFQEARVSRAVELMVAYVENLKRRHDRNVAALEEAKKLIQQQESCSNIAGPRASPGFWLCSVILTVFVLFCCCTSTFDWLLVVMLQTQRKVTTNREALTRFAEMWLVAPSNNWSTFSSSLWSDFLCSSLRFFY